MSVLLPCWLVNNSYNNEPDARRPGFRRKRSPQAFNRRAGHVESADIGQALTVAVAFLILTSLLVSEYTNMGYFSVISITQLSSLFKGAEAAFFPTRQSILPDFRKYQR
jgi:hypothetical protein